MRQIRLKFLPTALAFLSLLAASCMKQEIQVQDRIDENGKITLTVEGLIGGFEESDATKASALQTVRVSWDPEDIVYVFQGSEYLGFVTTPKTIENDKVAILSGKITKPSGETPNLTFVYSNMFTGQPVVTDGKISVDMSSQGAKDIPFVLYGTKTYNKEELSDLQVSFKFATSMLIVATTNLKQSTNITSAMLSGVNTKCDLTLGDNGEVSVSGSTLGNITRTSGFNEVKDAGTSYIRFGIPECGSDSKTLAVEQGDAVRMKAGFTSSELKHAKSYSAIVNTEVGHKISLTSSNVSVDLDKYYAKEGETVSFTLTTEGNYMLCTLDVKDSENNDVTLSVNDNTRTFTMPAKNVMVKAICKPSVIDGVFTAGTDGHKVKFSRGNLYAKKFGDNWNWSFYGNQWQYNSIPVDENGERKASHDDTEIDLFIWSYDENYSLDPTFGADYYKPESFTDWGTALANKLPSTGTSKGWRTLAQDTEPSPISIDGEMDFIIHSRTASTISGVENACFIKCKVNGISGLLIFPDSFTCPSEVDIPGEYINNKDADYTKEDTLAYSEAEFDLLESAGCVFLPNAGYRYGGSVRYVGKNGCYWLSTVVNESSSYFMRTDNTLISSVEKYCGLSVRLVTDVPSE